MKLNNLFSIIVIGLATLPTSACTTLQKQSTGKAAISGQNYNSVFSAAVQAAVDSGMVITKAEKENGFILATASNNPFLTTKAPAINILVREADNTINITIKSTIHGQLVDYGTSSNNVKKFCESFGLIYPTSSCGLI